MFQTRRSKYRNFSDEELVEHYKTTEDTLCMSIIYERYSHLVMGTSMKYIKNVELSEDITMQIFEGLFNKLKTHNINYFKSWLYMVTKNECLMLLRKSNMEIPSDLQAKYDLEDEHEDYSTLKDNQIQLLLAKIDLLKEPQKSCIELFYIKEMSYQQISDRLKITINKVKSAVQNGKRNLKLLLEQENEFKAQS